MAPKPKTDRRGMPVQLPGPIGDLARAMDGKGNLALEVGVDEKTVYRWAHDGRVGSNALKVVLSRLFKRFKIEAGVEEFLKASGPKPRGINPRLKLGDDGGKA